MLVIVDRGGSGDRTDCVSGGSRSRVGKIYFGVGSDVGHGQG